MSIFRLGDLQVVCVESLPRSRNIRDSEIVSWMTEHLAQEMTTVYHLVSKCEWNNTPLTDHYIVRN